MSLVAACDSVSRAPTQIEQAYNNRNKLPKTNRYQHIYRWSVKHNPKSGIKCTNARRAADIAHRARHHQHPTVGETVRLPKLILIRSEVVG